MKRKVKVKIIAITGKTPENTMIHLEHPTLVLDLVNGTGTCLLRTILYQRGHYRLGP